jgi:hypothetical protein
MSFALIAVVMSIGAALGLLALRALARGRLLPHFFAVASRFVHPTGAGSAPSVALRRDGLQEGWALIDRALRARHAIKFDVR